MELFKVYINNENDVIIQVSIWLIVCLISMLAIYLIWLKKKLRFKLVKLNIKLGSVGAVELRPSKEDLQIAHKIWTELVTRKAAIPIDENYDVIEDIYNSWYTLFQRTREFISDIPADSIRKNKSTREIVRLAVQTLNDGLRPHLTRWQAEFRAWSKANKDELSKLTPQQFQKEYPDYRNLIEDLLKINKQLREYAAELQRMINRH